MMTATTVWLDDALLKRLARFVPLDNFSALVADLLDEHLLILEQTEIAMQHGYLATRAMRGVLNDAWQIADGDAWPD